MLIILVDTIPEPVPIIKEDLIKRMKEYNPGVEAGMLRRFLELRKPFTRIAPVESTAPNSASQDSDHEDDGWDGDGSVDMENYDDDDPQTEDSPPTNFGGFLGADSGCATEHRQNDNTSRLQHSLAVLTSSLVARSQIRRKCWWNAILRSFNNINLTGYLDLCWRILKGDIDGKRDFKTLVVVRLCSSHTTKTMSTLLK